MVLQAIGGGGYDYVQNTTPSGADVGESWLDTSVNPPVEKVYADVGSGGSWLQTESDSTISENLDAPVSEAGASTEIKTHDLRFVQEISRLQFDRSMSDLQFSGGFYDTYVNKDKILSNSGMLFNTTPPGSCQLNGNGAGVNSDVTSGTTKSYNYSSSFADSANMTLTGRRKTQTQSISFLTVEDGDINNASVNGNEPPTGPSTNNKPELTIEGASVSVSDTTNTSNAQLNRHERSRDVDSNGRYYYSDDNYVEAWSNGTVDFSVTHPLDGTYSLVVGPNENYIYVAGYKNSEPTIVKYDVSSPTNGGTDSFTHYTAGDYDRFGGIDEHNGTLYAMGETDQRGLAVSVDPQTMSSNWTLQGNSGWGSPDASNATNWADCVATSSGLVGISEHYTGSDYEGYSARISLSGSFEDYYYWGSGGFNSTDDICYNPNDGYIYTQHINSVGSSVVVDKLNPTGSHHSTIYYGSYENAHCITPRRDGVYISVGYNTTPTKIIAIDSNGSEQGALSTAGNVSALDTLSDTNIIGIMNDTNVTKFVEGCSSPSVDIGNDGTDDITVSGFLSGGSSQVYELSNLDVNDHNISFSATSGACDLVVNFTENVITEDPSIDVNGNTVSYTGKIQPGNTKDISSQVNSNWIVNGTNTLDVTVSDLVGGPSGIVGVEHNVGVLSGSINHIKKDIGFVPNSIVISDVLLSPLTNNNNVKYIVKDENNNSVTINRNSIESTVDVSNLTSKVIQIVVEFTRNSLTNKTPKLKSMATYFD